MIKGVSTIKNRSSLDKSLSYFHISFKNMAESFPIDFSAKFQDRTWYCRVIRTQSHSYKLIQAKF